MTDGVVRGPEVIKALDLDLVAAYVNSTEVLKPPLVVTRPVGCS
ncbi:hypothetical protein [Streptomyces olivochromogenes]|nr:hypothetical protein [Streptomyces olivochromogenes]